MTSSALRLIACLLMIINSALCHSWLACTDYVEKNGATWNGAKCRGFPRGGHRKAPKNGVFGGDSGFDHSPNEKNPCQVTRNDGREYTSDHPMAVYYPGQQVILVHPMKNHGADSACTNVHIPDTGSWIYRSERNPRRDPTLTEFKRNTVFDLGKSPTGKDFNGDLSLSSVYPKPGYQNAPKFCEDTDKAMGTFAFNVPKRLTPGKYTFMWLWAFNSDKNLYSSCFEVEIVRNKVTRDRMLKKNGMQDTTEPCGGMTSNRDIAGNSNPGCTNTPAYKYAEMPKEEQRNTDARPWDQQSFTTQPWYFRTDTTKTTTTPSPNRDWNWFTTSAQRTRPIRRPAVRRTTTTTPAPYEYYYENEDYYSYYGDDNKEVDYYLGSDSTSDNNQQPLSTEPAISSVDSDIPLSVMVLQFGGEIPLPAARSTAVRRHYAVEFGCDVQTAAFWNSEVTNEGEIAAPNSPRRRYEVMQEGVMELQKLSLYYHVNYKELCDMVRFPPRAKLIREEYQNL